MSVSRPEGRTPPRTGKRTNHYLLKNVALTLAVFLMDQPRSNLSQSNLTHTENATASSVDEWENATLITGQSFSLPAGVTTESLNMSLGPYSSAHPPPLAPTMPPFLFDWLTTTMPTTEPPSAPPTPPPISKVSLTTVTRPIPWPIQKVCPSLTHDVNTEEQSSDLHPASLCHDRLRLTFFSWEALQEVASSDFRLQSATLQSAVHCAQSPGACNGTEVLFLFPMSLSRSKNLFTTFLAGPPRQSLLQEMAVSYERDSLKWLTKNVIGGKSSGMPLFFDQWDAWTVRYGQDVSGLLGMWLDQARMSFGVGNLPHIALPLIVHPNFKSDEDVRSLVSSLTINITYTMEGRDKSSYVLVQYQNRKTNIADAREKFPPELCI